MLPLILLFCFKFSKKVKTVFFLAHNAIERETLRSMLEIKRPYFFLSSNDQYTIALTCIKKMYDDVRADLLYYKMRDFHIGNETYNGSIVKCNHKNSIEIGRKIK